ncbi:hypothetical protein IQ238_14775 [Pleurocapsales cyanobacterium LEGE 06147]|nr:hypothetical protein [Pleurocapsales cyanobacterium LEGE 06147]
MTKRLDNYSGLFSKLWNIKGAIALAAIALIFPISNLNAEEISKTTNQKNTIAQTNGEQTEQPAQTEQQREQITSDEVTDRAEEFIGQTVTVRGRFIEAIDDNGFTITPERIFEAEPILIVNVTGTPLDLPSDDIRVQATGDVREFTLDEIAQEYNMEFDRATYALYENTPVIIARSIAPAPQPQEISGNPDQYYNRQIAVEANIGNAYSPQAFTLDDDLLVLNLNPEFDHRQQVQATDANGQRVVVTGVLRPFNMEELQREYDLATLDENVQRQLAENYANRPVLISDGVYPFPTEDRDNNMN